MLVGIQTRERFVGGHSMVLGGALGLVRKRIGDGDDPRVFARGEIVIGGAAAPAAAADQSNADLIAAGRMHRTHELGQGGPGDDRAGGLVHKPTARGFGSGIGFRLHHAGSFRPRVRCGTMLPDRVPPDALPAPRCSGHDPEFDHTHVAVPALRCRFRSGCPRREVRAPGGIQGCEHGHWAAARVSRHYTRLGCRLNR